MSPAITVIYADQRPVTLVRQALGACGYCGRTGLPVYARSESAAASQCGVCLVSGIECGGAVLVPADLADALHEPVIMVMGEES